MSRLTLVRHGQARAFEDDSDRLSEAGIEQALSLGQYFVSQRIEFQEVYSGSLERQKRTMLLISNAYRDARMPWPSMRMLPGWNEYDAPGVLTHLAPLLAARNSQFAALLEASNGQRHTADANRYFQRMFEPLLSAWMKGEVEHPEVESWVAFRARVESALRRILAAEGESRNILVVSSGGPIATAVQVLLESPPRMALELNWRMRNASITEFLFTQGRVTMDLFNSTGHLDRTKVTYR